jgi:hypothetical protein
VGDRHRSLKMISLPVESKYIVDDQQGAKAMAFILRYRTDIGKRRPWKADCYLESLEKDCGGYPQPVATTAVERN